MNETHFTENDIRPEDLAAEAERCYFEDVKFLINRKEEFVDVDCPACNSDVKTYFDQKNGFHYYTCDNCETLYMNPRADSNLLSEFYHFSKNYEYWNKKIFPASAEVRRNKIFIPRIHDILKILTKYEIDFETMIEVGPGFGIFCEELGKLKKFKRIVAIEPSADLAQTCRGKGIECYESSIENFKEDIKADIVCSFEVIEHLSNPRNFVKKCFNLLNDDGILVLTTPNAKGFEVGTIGIDSKTIDHEHINLFNPKSLAILLGENGFDVLETTTPGKLDAEMVRDYIIKNKIDVYNDYLLREILIERWEEMGGAFQDFLANNNLSSHMWIVGRKKSNWRG